MPSWSCVVREVAVIARQASAKAPPQPVEKEQPKRQYWSLPPSLAHNQLERGKFKVSDITDDGAIVNVHLFQAGDKVYVKNGKVGRTRTGPQWSVTSISPQEAPLEQLKQNCYEVKRLVTRNGRYCVQMSLGKDALWEFENPLR